MTRIFGMQLRTSKGRYDATGNGNSIVVYPDKKYWFLNGIRLYQCYTPLVKDSATYVSRIDYIKTFTPLLGSKIPYKHPIGTIFLDCGHGGKDHGASGEALREKDITLHLGRRLSSILRAYGYKAVLSREADVYIPLERRALLQALTRSDLFISLHVNSTTDHSVSGIETYCMTPAGASSSNSNKPDVHTYNGNQYDPNNLILAWNIQRSMHTWTNAQDRGVKRARFQVLRDIRCPGVLVEIGFVSNPSEERLLANPAYIEKIARGIASGILEYHRSLNK